MNGVPLQGAAAVVASEVQSKQPIKPNTAQNAVKQVTIGLNKQPKMVGPYVNKHIQLTLIVNGRSGGQRSLWKGFQRAQFHHWSACCNQID